MQSEHQDVSIAGAVEPVTSDRKLQLLELLAFLFLIVPSMVESFFSFQQAGAGFDLIAWATILRDIALVSLVAFFLWRNRERMILVGWSMRAAAREVSLGIVLFFPMMILTDILDGFLRSSGLPGTPKAASNLLAPKGGLELALAVLLVTVVAVAEETIFRGYLILRIRQVTGSTLAAVFLSSAIFSVGHGYEGAAGVVTVGAIGLVLAAVYLWRGTLVAPVTMHFLQDFAGIVALPWLGHRH